MKFDEFYNGQIIHEGPYLVKEEEMLLFARNWDVQWYHTDPEKAPLGPFKGLICSGWHTCAIAMSMITRGPMKDSESYASPGIEQIRWPNPVRPGDLLSLTVNVIEARYASSNPDRGILRWDWHMHNQRGEEVLSVKATSFFDKKLANAPW